MTLGLSRHQWWAGPGLGLAFAAVALAGQALPKAVAIAQAPIYLSPDATSTKVGNVQPGETLGLLSSGSGAFVQVFATARGAGTSGWITNRGYIRLDDPAAAEVLFGTAVRLQYEAEAPGGDRQMALDAAAIYHTVYDDFQASARADEALYRSAAIPWNLLMSEEPTRRTPEERLFPDDTAMRRVLSKLGHTEWAARADFALIVEHFTCGNWFDKPSCVEKEASQYLDYVKKYPDGPDSAEAAYDALYREAMAWTLYRVGGAHPDSGKAAHCRAAVAEQAAALGHAFPASDWSAQAAVLAYNVAHGVPLTVPGTPPLGGP